MSSSIMLLSHAFYYYVRYLCYSKFDIKRHLFFTNVLKNFDNVGDHGSQRWNDKILLSR